MELTQLMKRLKLEYLPDTMDTLCERASKNDLNYREFLTDVLKTE